MAVASAEATDDGWIYRDCLGFWGLGLWALPHPSQRSLVALCYFSVWILPVNLIPLRGNPLVLQPMFWAC